MPDPLSLPAAPSNVRPSNVWPESRTHVLPDGCLFVQGELPAALRPDDAWFEALWASHPDEPSQIRMHGRWVATPRWTRGFGTEYLYSGRPAAPDGAPPVPPVPPELAPLLRWGQATLEPRLNAVHVNWYDAALGHYIGPHRDYRTGMHRDTPIVTMSFGADRVFRIKPWRRAGERLDFAARHGTVFVIPWATNLRWTHEVPLRARDRGRRISVTLRALTGRHG